MASTGPAAIGATGPAWRCTPFRRRVGWASPSPAPMRPGRPLPGGEVNDNGPRPRGGARRVSIGLCGPKGRGDRWRGPTDHGGLSPSPRPHRTSNRPLSRASFEEPPTSTSNSPGSTTRFICAFQKASWSGCSVKLATRFSRLEGDALEGLQLLRAAPSRQPCRERKAAAPRHPGPRLCSAARADTDGLADAGLGRGDPQVGVGKRRVAQAMAEAYSGLPERLRSRSPARRRHAVVDRALAHAVGT